MGNNSTKDVKASAIATSTRTRSSPPPPPTCLFAAASPSEPRQRPSLGGAIFFIAGSLTNLGDNSTRGGEATLIESRESRVRSPGSQSPTPGQPGAEPSENHEGSVSSHPEPTQGGISVEVSSHSSQLESSVLPKDQGVRKNPTPGQPGAVQSHERSVSSPPEPTLGGVSSMEVLPSHSSQLESEKGESRSPTPSQLGAYLCPGGRSTSPSGPTRGGIGLASKSQLFPPG